MFCTNCGKKIEDGLDRCPYCNAKVEDDIQKNDEPDFSKYQHSLAPRYKLRKFSFIKYLLLSIVTCGIYSIVLLYRFNKTVNMLCEGDNKKSMNYILVLLLGVSTFGIYPLIWINKQGQRLYEIAPKYRCDIKEKGSTFLLWNTFGRIIVVGPYIAWYQMFRNINQLIGNYNQGNMESNFKPIENKSTGKTVLILLLYYMLFALPLTIALAVIVTDSNSDTTFAENMKVTQEAVHNSSEKGLEDKVKKIKKNSVVERLSSFTNISIGDEKYLFSYAEEDDAYLQKWSFVIAKGNSFLKLYDYSIVSDVKTIFGEDALEKEYIVYSLPDNRISVYLDPEVTDGVSIFSYMIDSQEYEVLYNGEHYGASDNLISVIEEYNIIDRTKNDYVTCEKLLEKNDVKMKELKKLDYHECADILSEMFENEVVSYQTESKATEKYYTTDYIESENFYIIVYYAYTANSVVHVHCHICNTSAENLIFNAEDYFSLNNNGIISEPAYNDYNFKELEPNGQFDTDIDFYYNDSDNMDLKYMKFIVEGIPVSLGVKPQTESEKDEFYGTYTKGTDDSVSKFIITDNYDETYHLVEINYSFGEPDIIESDVALDENNCFNNGSKKFQWSPKENKIDVYESRWDKIDEEQTPWIKVNA